MRGYLCLGECLHQPLWRRADVEEADGFEDALERCAFDFYQCRLPPYRVLLWVNWRHRMFHGKSALSYRRLEEIQVTASPDLTLLVSSEVK